MFIAGSLVALDGLGAGVAGGAAVETPATLLGLSVRGWNDCWLDLYDMVAEGILMPLGALVMTILIGWVLKPEVVQLECEQSGLKYRAAGYFKALLQVHRAGAARVHPLLPAHRLLRPEDPRPELNPAKNSVSVCPNGRALTFL